MPTYQFATITTPEAASYNAATDDLQFTGVTGATATNIMVSGAYTLRIISTGASVNLGFGAHHEVLTLPDGSKLVFPTDGKSTISGGAAGDHLYGGPESDELNGLGGSDKLEGGTFADTLNGGSGQDTLVGEAGIDVFVFAPGDSGILEGKIDVITDWSGDERLAFTTVDGSTYAEASAATFADALSLANGQIGTGATDVFAVAVGNDVIVFADTRGDNGTADDAILLAGRGLGQISAANIVRYSAGQSPNQPSAGGGTAGADTLTSTGGGAINGLGGDDSLAGRYSGFDTLSGGDGNDTLDGLGDDNVLYGDAGADVIISNGSGDTIYLGAGADLVRMRGGGQADFEGDEARIVDWSPTEDAIRFLVESGNYTETTAGTFAAARSAANALALQGYTMVAVQVGADVIVFGNPFSGSRMDSAIRLVDRTLDDVSKYNLGVFDPPPPVAPDGVPAAPNRPTETSIVVVGNVDSLNVDVLDGDDVDDVSPTRIVLDGPGIDMTFGGADFGVGGDGALVGLVTNLAIRTGALQINATTPGAFLKSLVDAIDADATSAFLAIAFGRSDHITGSAGPDLIRGYFGSDVIHGNGGGDTIYAGDGNDVVYASNPSSSESGGASYLRGDAGSDWIRGSSGFDDINGNEGNDTGSGGSGDDWVVGGKDNDRLFGESGNDLVYGNLGSDTCDGGEGNDTLRGGQDRDVLWGGAGDDYVSGDKGDDTVSGGAGADLFHTFGDAGIDRVLDFNLSEGDRVLLDPGTQYTVAQDGADTVISMTGGGQMVLVGVQLGSLTPGWIFGA